MRSASGPRGQRGYILLAILAIVFSVSAYLLVTAFSPVSLRLAQERRTHEALAEAKAALIGYAIAYQDSHPGEVPGYLPCPDVDGSNGEGSAVLNCGARNVSAIGRLPWKTLGLPPLRDGSGECLWYAVAGTYKNNVKSDLMNWDSQGQFDVYAADGAKRLAGAASDGTTTRPDTRAVAVIYAPGRAVERSGTTQSRAQPDPSLTAICGGNYDRKNYLDRVIAPSNITFDNAALSGTDPTLPGSANGVGKYIAAVRGATFNDRLVYITAQDIWNATRKRVDLMPRLQTLTRKTADCVAGYGNSNPAKPDPPNPAMPVKLLPFAAPLALTDYGNKDLYDDDGANTLMAGRLPYALDQSNALTLNTKASLFDGCAGWTADDQTWWEAWKDQLFYAVAFNFRPSASAPYGAAGCAPLNQCLLVGGTRYAAVVFLSAPKLASGQSRNFDASLAINERQNVANYLEGGNPAGFPNATGNAQYFNPTPSATFNDVLYCVDGALLVSPCP